MVVGVHAPVEPLEKPHAVVASPPRITHPEIRIVLERELAVASSRQADLFAPDPQTELFDGEVETPAYVPDIDKVRARLQKILAETRSADALPRGKASLYQTIFPQMTQWLPEDEAAQLRFEFEAEMERLKAA